MQEEKPRRSQRRERQRPRQREPNESAARLCVAGRPSSESAMFLRCFVLRSLLRRLRPRCFQACVCDCARPLTTCTLHNNEIIHNIPSSLLLFSSPEQPRPRPELQRGDENFSSFYVCTFACLDARCGLQTVCAAASAGDDYRVPTPCAAADDER